MISGQIHIKQGIKKNVTEQFLMVFRSQTEYKLCYEKKWYKAKEYDQNV
jgi:dimeric dUTPase (all-alpha-NTP-PPase superfamily)